MFEQTLVTSTTIKQSSKLTENFRQLNLNGAKAMLANFDGLNLNNKKFLSKINKLKFFRFPSLSLRLQVFNPHPNQFYCDQLINCFFCNFKRQRQPDDENLIKKTQKSILNLMKIKISTTSKTQITKKNYSKQLFSKKNSNKQLNEKITFNYDNSKINNKFFYSINLLSSFNFKNVKKYFNNNKNDIDNNFLLNHDKKINGFINNLNINKISENKHKKLSKFNKLKILSTFLTLKKKPLLSSSTTSIFTTPLLTIEEKIVCFLNYLS